MTDNSIVLLDKTNQLKIIKTPKTVVQVVNSI